MVTLPSMPFAKAFQPSDTRRPVSLSTADRSPRERRLALLLLTLSTLGFVAAVPFATVPLLRVDAFIPGYEAALAISDLITAVLLFGQYANTRSRAQLVLACGYLYT